MKNDYDGGGDPQMERQREKDPEDWCGTDMRRENVLNIEYATMLESLWSAQSSIRAAHKSFLKLLSEGENVDYSEISQCILEIFTSADAIINTPSFVKGQQVRDEAVRELLKKVNN